MRIVQIPSAPRYRIARGYAGADDKPQPASRFVSQILNSRPPTRYRMSQLMAHPRRGVRGRSAAPSGTRGRVSQRGVREVRVRADHDCGRQTVSTLIGRPGSTGKPAPGSSANAPPRVDQEVFTCSRPPHCAAAGSASSHFPPFAPLSDILTPFAPGLDVKITYPQTGRALSKYPPAEPGALVVSRSKRHDVTAMRSLEPPHGGDSTPTATDPDRRSSRSCCWMYSRMTRSSRPTVDTK